MSATVLLAIDVSNTQTVLGVYEGQTLRQHWRLQTHSGRTADEYGVLVGNLLAGAGNPPIGGIAVSSSVPPMTQVIDTLCRTYMGVAPMFVGPGIRTGMPRGSSDTACSGCRGSSMAPPGLRSSAASASSTACRCDWT